MKRTNRIPSCHTVFSFLRREAICFFGFCFLQHSWIPHFFRCLKYENVEIFNSNIHICADDTYDKHLPYVRFGPNPSHRPRAHVKTAMSDYGYFTRMYNMDLTKTDMGHSSNV